MACGSGRLCQPTKRQQRSGWDAILSAWCKIKLRHLNAPLAVSNCGSSGEGHEPEGLLLVSSSLVA